MKSKQLPVKYRNIIVEFTGVITAILMFSSGIGRYRFVIVYALYSLFKALLSSISVEQSMAVVVLPLYIIAFYLDVINGPIAPIFLYNNLVLAILAATITSHIVKKVIHKILSDVTAGQFFVVCPVCHYNNKDLVGKCINCSHENGCQVMVSASKISPDMQGDKIHEWLLNLLNVSEDEVVLFHKIITSDVAILRNGTRQVRRNFIITTASLIFLDYVGFNIRIPSSWRDRDVIPLAEITAVEGKMKRRKMALRPFLIIRTTHGDVYEIVFSPFGKYMNEINSIAAIIKQTNTQVELSINLTEQPWKDFF